MALATLRKRLWPVLQAVKRALILALNWTAYPLSGLFPRSRRIWAFGHTRDLFAGNPKYLFLWIALHRPDLRPIWISGSRATVAMLRRAGHAAHLRWSPAGMWAALRAGAHFSSHGADTVNASLSRGALLVNLWHGVGLKAVHLGFAEGMTGTAHRNAQTLFGRLTNFDRLLGHGTVITTSPMMQRHFSEQFRLPESRCPMLGYPRLDGAADPGLDAAARSIDRAEGFVFPPPGYRETYIYVPTFRDTRRPFLAEALPDLAALSDALAARGAMLYLKPHLRTGERIDIPFDNIRLWPNAIDFQTYLGDFTGLITDYSSVLYDFIRLRDEGAILYTFDLDRYLSADRALLYPFDDNVAGVRVSDFAALCAALRDGAALSDAQAPAIRTLRERFWGGAPFPSSPAVTDYVEERLKRGDV